MGIRLKNVINDAERTGEPQIINMRTIGRMSDSVVVG